MRLRTPSLDLSQTAGPRQLRPEEGRRPRPDRSAGPYAGEPVARSAGAGPGGVVATALPVGAPKPSSPDLKRTVVRAACIGALGSVTAVTVAVAVNGGGMASIGAGIMVAGFDGIPFGAMIGAMLHFMRHPEEQ